MPPESLERRTKLLENTVDGLRGLPARFDRLESDVSLVRAELGSFRGEFLQFRDDTRSEFSAIRQEIKAGDEETRNYMRIVHEETLARIALSGEGRRSRRGRP